jgi:hypothetical protein
MEVFFGLLQMSRWPHATFTNFNPPESKDIAMTPKKNIDH